MLTGRDRLVPDTGDGDAHSIGGLAYAVRFHIHPDVRVSRLEGGTVYLDVFGAPFTVYPLQFAPNLKATWSGIGAVTTDALGIGNFQQTKSDNPAPGLLQSFYRLKY